MKKWKPIKIFLLGPCIRAENAAAAAAAAMAAATNKFLRQQSNLQANQEEKQACISSPTSPVISPYSSILENTNDLSKGTPGGMPSAASHSLESYDGDEPAYTSKVAPAESCGTISNDVESNCSTVNSNE